MLEVSLARGGNHPGWLLFDAPKQHELSQTDFDAYTERLQLIAAKHPGRVQVVFSVADLKTQFHPGDEVWMPSFTIDGFRAFWDRSRQPSVSLRRLPNFSVNERIGTLVMPVPLRPVSNRRRTQPGACGTSIELKNTVLGLLTGAVSGEKNNGR